ncbi:MAG TPA: LysR family transcriptional regulator, partial [Acidisoma sp.]|uniref:LysR family transcriptional regulator n=1 Tax=Acidisoma sp. TaxID=1872115 RepID=UPI002B946D2D
MLSVTLRQLEYAVAIETHGGVSAAAAALHVSQPAVSVALTQIEALLGKPLFLRRPGARMAATSFGREFLARARLIIAETTTLLTLDDAAPQTPVLLGVFEDLAPLLLAPILARAALDLPEIEIRWQTLTFEEIARQIGRGPGLDLAITYNLGLDSACLRQVLLDLPLQVVVSRAHPFAKVATVTLAEVAAEPIILTEQELSRAHMLQLFERAGLHPRIAHHAGTTETMRSLAANGLGVGLSYTSPRSTTSY